MRKNETFMNNLKQSFGKFLFPGFLLALGLFLVIFALAGDQNGKFIFGGLAVLLIGGIAMAYTLGVITKQLQTILTLVMVVGGVALGFYDYRSIKDDIDFQNRKKEVYEQVIQRLKDVREAQLAHKKLNGTYANTFDSLLTFLKEGKMPIIKAIGSVPDTLTESEALEMGIIVRDTIYEPVMNRVFLSEEAQKERKFEFQIDSLRYAPISGAELYMKVDAIASGGQQVPVFLLKDMKPFDISDTLMVGSLTEASTNGNWSGE